QNYVVGLSREGLALDADQHLDIERSFTRVNYFSLLHDQRVRNNVQPALSNYPIDFVAVRVPSDALSGVLDQKLDEDPIWLYGGQDKQALILSRFESDGSQSFRYLPVIGLRQD